MDNTQAILVLEDGRRFEGVAIGSAGAAFGEVVFNTSMTGYQEIISDPSYCGQIVVFTATQIGNYGVCDLDLQASRPVLSGVVIRELSAITSNWRAQTHLNDWLVASGIVGISEVDTRAVTRHIREQGALRAGIWNNPPFNIDLVEQVQRSQSLVGANLTDRVCSKEPYLVVPECAERARVVLIDFGVKLGIIKSLTKRGIAVQVLPANASVDDVLSFQPLGLVLSNGPGDPAAVTQGIDTARALIGKMPILGICLGHQILGLALGAKTIKLRFGHHGGNHPVQEKYSEKILITAQNHGFAVDASSICSDDIEITHISLYDGTLEGFRSRNRKILAYQYHPEACPGPSDGDAAFDEYISMLGRSQANA